MEYTAIPLLHLLHFVSCPFSLLKTPFFFAMSGSGCLYCPYTLISYFLSYYEIDVHGGQITKRMIDIV